MSLLFLAFTKFKYELLLHHPDIDVNEDNESETIAVQYACWETLELLLGVHIIPIEMANIKDLLLPRDLGFPTAGSSAAFQSIGKKSTVIWKNLLSDKYNISSKQAKTFAF